MTEENKTQDTGIAALDALSGEDAAPEKHEEIVDPIVAAAQAVPEKGEAKIDDAPTPPGLVKTVQPHVLTRLELAEIAVERAKENLKSTKDEFALAAKAEADGAPRQLSLVEMNALARKQQAPEAADRRAVHELISSFGLMRRPHQTHSVVVPLPNTEAKVE